MYLKISKGEIIAAAIVVISFLFGWALYPSMPDLMASHWDASGQVNGYMSKFWGVYLMPIISAGMLLLLMIVPRVDPKKENIAQFRAYFDWFIVLIFLFLLYIYWLTIWWNVGGRFDMTRFLVPALGVLFYAVGVMVSKAKMNFSIGIRTPWTLSNEEVWRKTHRLGGILFRISGLLMLLSIFWPATAIWVVLAAIILSALVTVVYSYIEYRRQMKR
ncbi:MAG: SdpI family protein [Patescibacteria group bacterium]|nr:SdpI family protein [Patescibacteria group bacterium]